MKQHKMARQTFGRPVATYSIRWWFLLSALLVVWRFLTGQLVTRRPGRWDSRWTSWAPAPPAALANAANVDTGHDPMPRSRWARRPGYQRQIARLGAIAAVYGYLTARDATLAVLAALAAFAIARGLYLAHRHHQYAAAVEPWWDYVAAKIGATGGAWDHVRLPMRETRWEPIAPLAAATRPAPVPRWDADVDDPARDRGGWLTRYAPPLARILRPLAVPVSERAWVLRLRARLAVDHRFLPAIAARLIGRLVRLIERSRALRAWPRAIRHSLTDDDARVEIHYPNTYPAHPQDLAEIQRVLRDRLPARAPTPDAPAEDPAEDDTEDDPDAEPALPVGAWRVRNDARHLRLVATRTKVMPSSVTFTAEEFARRPLQLIPIGVAVSRTGRARVVEIPLKAQTPHVAGAASTGWGKTTIANVCAAHLLYHGAYLVILDPKEIGYVDAFRNAGPNVELWTSVEGWVEVIKRVLEEMDRRYRLMNECADRISMLGMPKMHEFPELYFQPLAMFEDEKGSLTTAIDDLWKQQGNKGTAAAFSWQQQILWRGRAAAVHVFTFAQQFNARVFLNTDMRDQYMFRIAAGPQTAQSWQMAFPGQKKRTIPRKKGRAFYSVGPDGIREVQLGRISDTDARAAAQHGIGVAEQENLARAEMLARATGRPLWEVSPLPFWVASPGQTASAVPGQAVHGDMPVAPQERGLALVKTVSEDVSGNDSGQFDEDAADAFDGDAAADQDDVVAAAEDGAGMVIGDAAAANFLGISEAAFKQRRKRAKRGEGPAIRGEVRIGRSPAWPPLELTEWNNLFRRAS
jgi:hypothetical protein